jgi:hypothetical protein
MSKTFRAWDVDQEWLLPASVHDFVPAGHAAHVIRDVVRETLDLGEIMAAYDEPRGYPPYHPAMRPSPGDTSCARRRPEARRCNPSGRRRAPDGVYTEALLDLL